MTDSEPTRTPPPADSRGDHVLRAMTDDGAFRVMSIRSTDTVRASVEAQQVTGIAAAQLANVMTAAALVRETMAPTQRVQILLRDKSGGLVVGDSFPAGQTRGLAKVRDDVLGVDTGPGGSLEVMRSLPGRPPHQGIVETHATDGIDGALMSYFQNSEQTETMIAIETVIGDDDLPEHAGGYIIQLLPELTDPPLEAMRKRLSGFGDLAPHLAKHDANPQWLLDALLGDEAYTRLADEPLFFGCGCGEQKAMTAVSTLDVAEIEELIEKGETLRVTCDYCREVFEVGTEQFKVVLAAKRAQS